jgi:hypothetical protein
MGDQVRGFGFLHNGSIDTIERFLSTTVFSLSSQQARDVETFVFAFDSNLAPIIGRQVTLTPTNAAVAGPRIDLLLARAGAAVPACDVVVHGIVDGVPRGWVRLPSSSGRSSPGHAFRRARASASASIATRTAASTATTRSPRSEARPAAVDCTRGAGSLPAPRVVYSWAQLQRQPPVVRWRHSWPGGHAPLHTGALAPQALKHPHGAVGDG